MAYRIMSYIYIIMVIIAGCAVFAIKNEVQNLTFQMNALKSQTVYEQDNINVLRAELSYLVSPQRLRALSDHYLTLVNITASQVVHDPLDTEEEQRNKIKALGNDLQLAKTVTVPRAPRWRYKHVSGKVRTASYTR